MAGACRSAPVAEGSDGTVACEAFRRGLMPCARQPISKISAAFERLIGRGTNPPFAATDDSFRDFFSPSLPEFAILRGRAFVDHRLHRGDVVGGESGAEIGKTGDETVENGDKRVAVGLVKRAPDIGVLRRDARHVRVTARRKAGRIGHQLVARVARRDDVAELTRECDHRVMMRGGGPDDAGEAEGAEVGLEAVA